MYGLNCALNHLVNFPIQLSVQVAIQPPSRWIRVASQREMHAYTVYEVIMMTYEFHIVFTELVPDGLDNGATC